MNFEDAKKLARMRWGIATAFRVGVIIGETGARIVNPYQTKRMRALYRNGLRWGRDRREGGMI